MNCFIYTTDCCRKHGTRLLLNLDFSKRKSDENEGAEIKDQTNKENNQYI